MLRVGIHTEPQTWNRLLATDRITNLVTDQLHEPLLRLDPETQRMEAALARSWEFEDGGDRLVLHLREGVVFSDGEPFGADDVVFTFRALYDPKVASPLMETALIDGEPFGVEALDELTVAFRLPRRTATIERIFDSIPMLPAHRLGESLERGTLPADTGLGAPIANVAGLGPFSLREHAPGERIVLERNPHYWKAAAGEEPLPKLDRVVFEIVPSESARLLRFRAGELDVLELVTPEAFDLLRSEGVDELELVDLGPGLLSERLWFNLNPNAPIEAHRKQWFGDVRFRRAISKALDRRGMARVVFGGRATPASGPVSVANSFWRDASLTATERDLDGARALLRESGFTWDGEGRLHDRGGRRVSFTIVTNAGNDQHSRMGSFVEADLQALGIEARTVPVEASSLLARLTGSFDYEACLLGITATDPDPSAEMALWLSQGPLHFWNPNQPHPATAWEARIDELMENQMSSLDPGERRSSYFEVQRIICENLPVLDLIVPHALVAVSRRVRNLRLTPLAHPLWNREEIYVDERGEKTTKAFRDLGH
jgi:peptide/nickel transport system substrate-binding protein